jgi:hypothetical protein
MRAFHHPASRPVARNPLRGFRVGSLGPTMGRQAPRRHQLVDLRVVITRVQTQVLGTLLRHARALDRQGIQRRPHPLHIRPIRSGHHHPPGQARTVGEQTTFGAALGAVGGVGPVPFPPRALRSSPPPSPAISSRCRRRHRTAGAQPSTVAQSPGLLPLLEAIVHGAPRPQAPRQGLPLTDSAQHVENGIQGLAVIPARPSASGFRLGFGQHLLEVGPQGVRRPPVGIHGGSSFSFIANTYSTEPGIQIGS